ncbi:MAG: hypothetical protein ACLFQK_03600 [Fibrobacterota bacterium]
MERFSTALLIGFFIIAVPFGVMAQSSLQSEFVEEEDFYLNYGDHEHDRQDLEREKITYYDIFGERITSGYMAYSLESRKESVSNDYQTDTTISAINSSMQTSKFYETFNNLIITNDAIGRTRTKLLIGNQIETRFSPLTFNKKNFEGIRWDIFAPSVKFTTMFSRTDPSFLSRSNYSGRAVVSMNDTNIAYQGAVEGQVPVSEDNLNQYFDSDKPNGENDNRGWLLGYGETSGDYNLGDVDYTNKSPYGDYDILWAFHGQNNIANKMDVGFSFINHHISDISKGEQFGGNVPDDFRPSEVHFEVYDLTPGITSDAGAMLNSFNVSLNGVDCGGPTSMYLVTEGGPVPTSTMKQEVSGEEQVMTVIFNIDRLAEKNGLDTADLRSIDFTYGVKGNYMVFVSTEKQIPVMVASYNQGERVDPITRNMDEMLSTVNVADPSTNYLDAHATSGSDFKQKSMTYYGDYISKASRVISHRDYNAMNVKVHSYSYQVNKASMTAGLDFNGEVAGIDVSGEFSLNRKTYEMPGRGGGDDKDPVYSKGAYLTLSKDFEINKMKLKLKMNGYRLDPQYDPGLNTYKVSSYFSKTSFMENSEDYPDYVYQPVYMSGNYNMIDDNDDRDNRIESDRPVYPYLDSDGKNYNMSGNLLPGRVIAGGRNDGFLDLPGGHMMVYGDVNGVISDRLDRNRNGILDYKEDFLLFDADPPVFELGYDMNNNGLSDFEDDDILPDYPGFIRPVYTLTSNGFVTQGIQGVRVSAETQITPSISTDLSMLYERAVDLDFDRDTEETFEAGDPSNLGVTAKAEMDVIKRSRGIQYYFGDEVKFVKDNIRNDGVVSFPALLEDVDISYYYRTDPMNFRNSLINNFVSEITYRERKLMVNAKALLGVQKNMAIDNGNKLFLKTIAYPLDDEFDAVYYNKYEPFDANLLLNSHFIFRTRYDINFAFDETMWYSRPLNLLNNLKIIPQYKFSYEKSSSQIEDPRISYRPGMTNEQIINARINWWSYSEQNSDDLLSVPILRFEYKIGERTYLEFGRQWYREIDRMLGENCHQRNTTSIQVVSKGSVDGQHISVIFGYKRLSKDYDFNTEAHPIYSYGEDYDKSTSNLFVKIYAGD